MRRISILITVLITTQTLAEAQPCFVKGYATANEICAGDSIQLSAVGGCSVQLRQDFNTGLMPAGLTITGTASLSNPCGPGIDNSTYLWMGSGTNSPRSVTTQPMNLIVGGACQICFDMKYGAEGQASPCDGPDLANEGVRLQYSINNGASWNDLQYWPPNGGFDSTLVNWGTYCLALPSAALSAQTMLRWIQTATLATTSGHWGLDNILLFCSSYVTFSWSTGHTGQITPWIHPGNNTTYTVTMTNLSTSQQYTDTVGVKVKFTPTANFSVVTPVCKDQISNITYLGNAGPGAVFNWTFPSGGNITGSGSGPYTASYHNPGDFDIYLSVSEGGCTSAVETREIMVEPLISFFLDPFNGCEPLTINIIDNSTPDSAGFQWNFGDPGSGASNTSVLPSPSHTYSTHGAFDLSVIVTTPAGCRDTLSLPDLINVYPKPVANFDAIPLIAPLSYPVISFTDLSQYTNSWYWDFGDPGSGSNTSILTSPEHSYGEGTFTVKLVITNQFGCTDSITKEVKVVDDILTFPNVFTPNGDGFNDYFVIENIEAVVEGKLVIYNRYGELVYGNSSYDNSFDAAGIPDGIYYYIFDYKTYFKKGTKSGTITIFHQ